MQPLNNEKTKFVSFVETKTSSDENTQYLFSSENKYISLDSDNCLVFEQAKRVWSEKMYLRPIPQSAIDMNQNLEQNPLWK